MKYFQGFALAAITTLAFLSTGNGLATAQTTGNQDHQESFWQDVDFELHFGFSSFNGDFQSYEPQYLYYPFPANGYTLGFYLNKPIGSNPRIMPNVRLGFTTQSYNSQVQFYPNIVSPQLASGGIVPTNSKNFAFGPEIGASVSFRLYRTLRIEPTLSFGLYVNNPRSDRFYDSQGVLVRPDNVPTNRITTDYNLADVPDALAPNEIIPPTLFAVNAGARLTFKVAGTEYFVNYQIRQFLEPYFDGVRDISTEQVNNMASMLAVGIKLPVRKGLREREIERDFTRQLQYVRRNMRPNNPEHREPFFDIFGDIALDRNTPGLNFNHLVAQVRHEERPMGNTDYMLQLSRLPGSTYMIGNTNEDNFNIQNYGRLRVSIQDFSISQTTVTNKQYKIFLAAMGASFDGSERYAAYVNGSAPSLTELHESAGLSGFSIPSEARIGSVDQLFPDQESWNRMNLERILPFDEYFFSEDFDNYPVVAVNWYQAAVFAAWAGMRLPYEVEWEYAAKAGIGGRVFPWDGYSAQDHNGNYLANFMQDQGTYNLDGYTLMAPVDAYDPNNFMLYNMAGNVSEWVADSYSNSYQVLRRSQMLVTPSNIDLDEPRKILRGGSWASSEYFIGSGIRNFGQGTMGTPMIGFRVATSRRFTAPEPAPEIQQIEIEPATEPEPVPPTPVPQPEPPVEEETEGEG